MFDIRFFKVLFFDLTGRFFAGGRADT